MRFVTRTLIVVCCVLVGCPASNPSAPCPPVYPWAELRVTPERVQVPAQVKLETVVNGLCPDLRVPEVQFPVTIRSGETSLVNGVATVRSGVSFSFEQVWNPQPGLSGVPVHGTVRLELRSVVQLTDGVSISSLPVTLEVEVP